MTILRQTITNSTSSTSFRNDSEDDNLMKELQDELQKNTLDDEDDDHSLSSSATSASIPKMQANMLTAAEQVVADEGMLHGVQIFFENQFIDAQRIFASQEQINPVYALGSGALAFMKACMTFSESDIQEAIKILQHSEALCGAHIHAAPKKATNAAPIFSSVSKMVSSGWSYFGYQNNSSSNSSSISIHKKDKKKDSNNKESKDNNKDSSISNNSNGASKKGSPTSTPPPSPPRFMTNGEIRARVIRAESLLLTSLLLLLQESFMSYLKAAMNLRKGYKAYEAIWAELQSMGDEVNTLVDNNTLGGIYFGLGTINIVLASMPTKILKVIASFGYSGDKTFGFELISKCIATKGIRSPLGSLMFLSYYTILAGFAPAVLGPTNIPIADKILQEALQDYKESAFFLYFEGRNRRLQGMIPESIAAFELASSKTTVEWGSELQRLCDYELGLNCAISFQWREAAVYFDKLANENYWSKAFFLYFKGASLEACGNKSEAIQLYQQIPSLVGRKFGGRTIMIEQYVTRKVKLFEQSAFENTYLPALEILLIWNAFASMSKDGLTSCLNQVDAQINSSRGDSRLDPIAVLKTIKGVILHQLERHKEASECLNWVIKLPAGKIADEKWVVPFAHWEAGIGCWMEDKNLKGDNRWIRAKALWDKAASFSGYEFEFRLSIRIHAAMMRINELGEEAKLKSFH
ncbi:Tetratricopeptide repeat protein 39B [Modicella reniformis]|uniref:Tetratricopeptide repeat protein 39B n=1 Tax=Modicella reniformis TaxID=1440133 RepID=A0A9P6INT7_9FUNG|nr:Tetratricopeptide repeat protein 39B [Modicella reniformis]